MATSTRRHTHHVPVPTTTAMVEQGQVSARNAGKRMKVEEAASHRGEAKSNEADVEEEEGELEEETDEEEEEEEIMRWNVSTPNTTNVSTPNTTTEAVRGVVESEEEKEGVAHVSAVPREVKQTDQKERSDRPVVFFRCGARRKNPRENHDGTVQ